MICSRLGQSLYLCYHALLICSKLQNVLFHSLYTLPNKVILKKAICTHVLKRSNSQLIRKRSKQNHKLSKCIPRLYRIYICKFAPQNKNAVYALQINCKLLLPFLWEKFCRIEQTMFFLFHN